MKPATEPKLQIEQLKRLCATTRCARALLNHAASQSGVGRGAEITVDSLHGILSVEQKTTVSRRELTTTLRAFAEAGCGRFVTGRRGKPSRFIWAQPPAAVATLGGALVSAKSSAATASPSAASGPERSAEPGMFLHPFRLRQNLVISVQLPVDLTSREAERLARFIETLPLKEQ